MNCSECSVCGEGSGAFEPEQTGSLRYFSTG
jgi:hypothetical protein